MQYFHFLNLFFSLFTLNNFQFFRSIFLLDIFLQFSLFLVFSQQCAQQFSRLFIAIPLAIFCDFICAGSWFS